VAQRLLNVHSQFHNLRLEGPPPRRLLKMRKFALISIGLIALLILGTATLTLASEKKSGSHGEGHKTQGEFVGMDTTAKTFLLKVNLQAAKGDVKEDKFFFDEKTKVVMGDGKPGTMADLRTNDAVVVHWVSKGNERLVHEIQVAKTPAPKPATKPATKPAPAPAPGAVK
jgi:hypothetical protein